MSGFYEDSHRRFQDLFGTRALADRVEQAIVHQEIDDESREFIESRDFFFLATVDGRGQPTVSHKGGFPGFVRVLDERTIAFPSFDGNGMYYSMGNIEANRRVGLLFIDFERPHRMRFQGEASVASDDPLLGEYKEAELVVRVSLSELFVNCPRYVHRHRRVEDSRYVPREGRVTPMAEWKRVEGFQDVLRDDERRQAEELGLISVEEYLRKVREGES